ncbi:endonuclease/exonuclease/phosphatase family protein [Chthonobacter albigriseus]|uniref:endonuclease/exonuclease/phosphatase family protein n=1 Tax=Chthonobacter albigriseus TaxID=1683161 RepID=UPI0015EF05F7|nr:endonuclease/exonuclease/phosphatase family protein [Chthonobacter albigriseus]
MRVMTWNIHGCVGTDGVRSPQRVADVVAAVTPDILAVQEVDLRESHGDPVPFFDLLEAHAGVHRHEVWTISDARRQYGIALISRWEILEARAVDLAYRSREPRTAIDAIIAAPSGPIRVIATHLGLGRGERRDQMRRLFEVVTPVTRPTILLGDFNDWLQPGAVGRLLAPSFPTAIGGRTFHARLPVFPLDRIYLSPHLKGTSLSLPLPRDGSDHLPVIADVQPT